MANDACEFCGELLSRLEPQYRVTIDIRPTTGYVAGDEDPGDRDHLLELHEMLEGVDDEVLSDPVEQGPCRHEMLLCHDCCRRFQQQPMPRDAALQLLEFSDN